MRGRQTTAGRTFTLTLLSLGLLAPTALPVPALTEGPWAAWVTDTVDEDFWSVPLGISTLSNGRPVISYSYTGLNIGTQTPLGDWTVQTIDTSTRQSDIVVDAQGTLHVAYALRSLDPVYSFDLAYATNQGGTWATQRVHEVTGGASVEAARIAVDPNNQPHILYTDDGFQYATPDGNGGWLKETIQVDHGIIHTHTGLSVDSTGTPHVTYSTSGSGIVTHATRTAPDTWIKTIVPRCSSKPSIAFDANDLAHVACRTPNGDGLGLVHAYETSPGTWAWEEAIHGNELVPPRSADEMAARTSIAINHDTGTIHIASHTFAGFSSLSPAHPIYATKTLAGWSVNTIDATHSLNGLRIDLALDGNGVPHVAYGPGTSVLQYARPATALPESVLPFGTLP